MTTTLTDLQIIGRCRTGELIDDIDRFERDATDPASLLARTIALHNAGKLDLLSLTQTAQFAALGGHMFFVLQHFLDQAIPLLATPVVPLMQAVKALVTKGGADGAANMPYDAFRKWCVADLARARSIVANARAGDTLSAEFLTFALRALEDLALAKDIAANFDDIRRHSALFALGRLPQVSDHDAQDTVTFLLPYIDKGQDDITRCNAMASGFAVCEKHPALAPTFLPQLVAASVIAPNPMMLYNLAQALEDQGALMDRASAVAALGALKAVDPATMGGVLHLLDVALSTLLSGPHADLALDYLTDVMSAGAGFSLEQFKSLAHGLATGDKDRLFTLVVRWLLTGKSELGANVRGLFAPGERGVPFDATTVGMGLTAKQQVFLCYKALGWLFTNEVVAASIMVAALRGAAKAEAEVIGNLLFDPLLTNYGGNAVDYLKTIKRGDAAYGPVRKALKAADAFIAGLAIQAPLKELRPSEYQRSVERTHVQDMMRKAHKDAEKHSVLLNLVHRSALLYGRRAITYVHGPGDERRAVSMDLHSFGTSFELPRSEIIDPVGLNIMLLRFRSLQPK